MTNFEALLEVRRVTSWLTGEPEHSPDEAFADRLHDIVIEWELREGLDRLAAILIKAWVEARHEHQSQGLHKQLQRLKDRFARAAAPLLKKKH